MSNAPKHPLILLGTTSLGLTAILAIAVGFAVPGIASDTAKSDKQKHVVVHVITHGDDAKASAESDESSVVAISSGCKGQMKRIDTESVTRDESGKTEKTRLVMCSMDGKSDGDMLARMKDARDRIATDKALSDGHKAKALAAIDAEIEKLKSGRDYPRQ